MSHEDMVENLRAEALVGRLLVALHEALINFLLLHPASRAADDPEVFFDVTSLFIQGSLESEVENCTCARGEKVSGIGPFGTH
jgi:hypothetical protein